MRAQNLKKLEEIMEEKEKEEEKAQEKIKCIDNL